MVSPIKKNPRSNNFDPYEIDWDNIMHLAELKGLKFDNFQETVEWYKSLSSNLLIKQIKKSDDPPNSNKSKDTSIPIINRTIQTRPKQEVRIGTGGKTAQRGKFTSKSRFAQNLLLVSKVPTGKTLNNFLPRAQEALSGLVAQLKSN